MQNSERILFTYLEENKYYTKKIGLGNKRLLINTEISLEININIVLFYFQIGPYYLSAF